MIHQCYLIPNCSKTSHYDHKWQSFRSIRSSWVCYCKIVISSLILTSLAILESGGLPLELRFWGDLMASNFRPQVLRSPKFQTSTCFNPGTPGTIRHKIAELEWLDHQEFSSNSTIVQLDTNHNWNRRHEITLGQVTPPPFLLFFKIQFGKQRGQHFLNGVMRVAKANVLLRHISFQFFR